MILVVLAAILVFFQVLHRCDNRRLARNAIRPMRYGRLSIWIGIADLLLCVVSMVIVAVAATKAKVEEVKRKAEFLISGDWPVTLDSDVDLWVGLSKEPVFYASRQVGCVSLDRDSIGNSTSLIVIIGDGSVVRAYPNEETTTLRCVAMSGSACIPIVNSKGPESRSPCASKLLVSIRKSSSCWPATSRSIMARIPSTSLAST
jgi:hypothetical protein